MPHIQLTENCQFVKETIIFDNWGPVYKNWKPHGPPKLYVVKFCRGPVLYTSVYGTSVARRTSHQGHGNAKID